MPPNPLPVMVSPGVAAGFSLGAWMLLMNLSRPIFEENNS